MNTTATMKQGNRVAVIKGIYWKEYGDTTNLAGAIVSTTRCNATVRLDTAIAQDAGEKQLITVRKTSLQIINVSLLSPSKNPMSLSLSSPTRNDTEISINGDQREELLSQEKKKREVCENQLNVANTQLTDYQTSIEKDKRLLRKKNISLTKKDQVIHDFRIKYNEEEAKVKKLAKAKRDCESEMKRLKIAHRSEMAEQKAAYTALEVQYQELRASQTIVEETPKKRKCCDDDAITTEAEISFATEERPRKRRKNKAAYPLPSTAPDWDAIRELLIEGGWKLKSQNGHYVYERPAIVVRERQIISFPKTPRSTKNAPKTCLFNLQKMG